MTVPAGALWRQRHRPLRLHAGASSGAGDRGEVLKGSSLCHGRLPRTAAVLQAGFAALTLLVVIVEEVPGDGVLARQSSADEVRALAVVVDRLTGYAGVAVVTVLLILLLARLRRGRDAVLCGVSVGVRCSAPHCASS